MTILGKGFCQNLQRDYYLLKRKVIALKIYYYSLEKGFVRTYREMTILIQEFLFSQNLQRNNYLLKKALFRTCREITIS
jgi:hypothetical protein